MMMILRFQSVFVITTVIMSASRQALWDLASQQPHHHSHPNCDGYDVFLGQKMTKTSLLI